MPGDHAEDPGRHPGAGGQFGQGQGGIGVMEAGLTTMGQPTASAGPALRVIMAAGKFQGVMAAQTPMGSLSTTIRLSRWCWGMVSP